MKKRILSLLCVLALCLGLLPVTALAVAEGEPAILYVGNQNVKSGEDTTYWTTDLSTGKLTLYTENGDDWNVKYDPNSATLTLKNATIEGEYDDVNTSGAGIYAASSSGPVSLNIVLEEENKVSGMYGIDVSSSGGDASLNISGSGSLTVSGLSGNGIGIFMSSQNSANLTIEEASVTALGSQVGGSGVRLITSQTGSPSLTIEVKGGSLQASGETNGIQFLSNVNDATAVANLKVSGNAMVKASNIITTKDGTGSAPELTIGASTGDTGGIVWNGSEGTVYGNVSLNENLTIGEGESLTIPEGASLNTNGNTITVENGGKLEGTPTGSGTVKIAPTITTESLPDGEVGTVYSQTLTATGDPTITWNVTSGTLPAGLTLGTNTGTISGTPTAEEAPTFTVTATNASGSDSKEYTIQIAAKSDTTPPMLTAGTVNRTSDTDATVTFTSDEAGTYFYKVVDSGAEAPTNIVSGTSTDMAIGENTINLTNLTAGAKDIYIVAQDASKNQSTPLKMEIPAYVEPVYSISADTTPLDFGSVYTGYIQPAAQTVTITNTGNQTLNLDQPASTNSFEVGNLSKTPLAPGEKATFTVQPKADLAVGSYKESINISGFNGNHTVSTSVEATFAVVDINDTSVDNKLTVTSGISDNITYYTCPSCGYHNWTATEAGYRCDNCGYLESTRQLSGYGNVKGTYTPGSGATSTAASAVPQTGDESNPVLWTVLLLVSGLALGGLAIAKRKKQQ